MTEVKLLFQRNSTSFQDALDKALSEGWFPQYESFRLDGDDAYSYFAILVTRP